MGVGDGRYRHEVSGADRRLVESVGIGPSDWFANSHDAMPVFPPALVEAIRLLGNEETGESPPAGKNANGDGSQS